MPPKITVKPPVPKTAAEIAKPLSLSPAALALLTPASMVRTYFEALATNPELAEDAAKFLAGALPKREAVWWGLCGLKETLKAPLPEPQAKALAEVEKWVRSPTETQRKAVAQVAEVAGRDNPAGCLASAAAFSGGSLAPPRQAVVKPPEHLTAIFLAVALNVAAVLDPAKTAAHRARFLELGKLVAAGQLKW